MTNNSQHYNEKHPKFMKILKLNQYKINRLSTISGKVVKWETDK